MPNVVPFAQFKICENTHGGVLLIVLLLVKKTCNFTKSNTLSWVFFTFYKLCKCYQIAQRTTNISDQCFDREKTDQEIFTANRLIGFFVNGPLVSNGLVTGNMPY